MRQLWNNKVNKWDTPSKTGRIQVWDENRITREDHQIVSNYFRNQKPRTYE